MNNFNTVVLAFILFTFVLVGLGALMAIPTMLLVNGLFSPTLLQTVFGGPISFLSAWGLNILCGFLFKSTTSSSKK